jgi:nucleoid DNA-binding protein
MAGKRRRDRMLALSGTSTIRSSPHAWPSPGSLSNGSHAALFVTIDVQRLPAIRRPYSPNSVEPSANERFWHSSVRQVFECMSDALRRGEGIEIRNFGSFSVRSYGAYKGRNPRDGQPVHVRAKRLPFFKVGKELRNRVNVAAPRSVARK